MSNIFLFLDNQKYGPYSIEQIEAWLNEGRVNSDSLCWYEGMSEWQTLKMVFPNLFQPSPPPLPPSPPVLPPSLPPQRYTNVNQVKKKKSGCFSCFLGCLTIIIIILVVIGGIAGYRYYKDKKATEDLPLNEYKDSNYLSFNTNTQTKNSILEQQLQFDDKNEIRLKKNNVEINIYNSYDSKAQELKISAINNFTLKKGNLLSKPIGIQLKNSNESNFPIEIQFKKTKNTTIDQMFCLSISENGNVDYPICFESNDSVKVITDHLTDFYPISSSGQLEYSPIMTLPTYFACSRVKLSESQTVSILKNYSKDINYIPGSAKMDFWKIFTEHFGISTNITAFAENAMYMEGFSKFNSYIPEVGLSLSFVQLGIDMYNGEQKSGVLNFTKNTGFYAIAKTFPTRAMNIAMVGVFVIDYSLNKFAETALTNRKQLYQKISSNWLSNRRANGETGEWWHKKLKGVIYKNKEEPWLIGSAIEREFDQYVEELWGDEVEIGVIQSQLGQTSFTGGGGLNKKLIEELSAELKFALKSYNKAVVEKLGKEYLIKQQNYSRDLRLKAIDYLNQKHRIRILVTSKGGKTESLKGIEVGIKVKDYNKQKMWMKKLSDNSDADIFCTNLGFINAGIPHIAYIKIPVEGENPLIIEKKFKLKEGNTTVEFKINTEDITGEWEGYFKIEKNTYFESMLKAAVFLFRAVGMDEKESMAKLAAAKSLFQEPAGLKRKRYLKMIFTSINGIEKYNVKATIEGDSGRQTYNGSATVKKGQLYFELKDKSGSIHYKGTVLSPQFITGTFYIGTAGFYAAEGKWELKKIK